MQFVSLSFNETSIRDEEIKVRETNILVGFLWNSSQHGVMNHHFPDDFTGKNPTDEYLETMMNEAPGPINFTMFLTMFGEKLNGTDPEDVIRNAFACFDEEGTGE